MTRLSKTNKRSVKKSTPLPLMSATVEAVEAAAGDVDGLKPLSDLSYKELQAMAKRYGFKANGTMADLIERLA